MARRLRRELAFTYGCRSVVAAEAISRHQAMVKGNLGPDCCHVAGGAVCTAIDLQVCCAIYVLAGGACIVVAAGTGCAGCDLVVVKLGGCEGNCGMAGLATISCCGVVG